jgi:pyruvate/2-oxoacid:ferredoxin oxidoreductase alpha subunit
MAYRLAEKILMPVMLTYDAFFLSHTTEVVDVPDIELVDKFLPPYRPEFKLDIDNPRMFGGLISPDYFYEHRYTVHKASQEALEYYPEVCREFRDIFGREYDITEEYRTDGAEVIVVTTGTITSVVRITVDKMREAGRKVGLMKLRMFRPVPVDRWRNILGNVAKVVVIDRNLSPGLGGVCADESQSALYPLENRPPIYPVVAGLGGRDVTPADIEGIINHALSSDDPAGVPLFWGLKE